MTPAQLLAAMDASWPAASMALVGPWTIRDGQDGGKRVSAATASAPWAVSDISLAETAMRDLGQAPLFMIGEGDLALDATLDRAGYAQIDPVIAYSAPAARVCETPPLMMTTFVHWPPMAIAEQLWAEGGITPARVAVMHRATGPKTAILGRSGDRASAAAFVAISGHLAMLHALEVTPALRRQGSAHNILRAAAKWALDHGAETLGLVVTAANVGARSLYTSLGMQAVGKYHYRQK